MQQRLEGKIAVVTGAGQGIGQAIALELARRGADIAVCDVRDDAEADSLLSQVAALGRRARYDRADVADAGSVGTWLDAVEQDLGGLDDNAIARWRNMHIGFVFQNFNLIPVLTALENVELPLKLTKLSKKERLEHAKHALDLVGLGDRLGPEAPTMIGALQNIRLAFVQIKGQTAG